MSPPELRRLAARLDRHAESEDAHGHPGSAERLRHMARQVRVRASSREQGVVVDLDRFRDLREERV